jgi:uncharacterized cofD-like protein
MASGETNPSVPLEVVVTGGGTGNSTVLSGLKPWVGEGLTAVVNTFDDGGGTGKIRQEYDGIAVGDMRQCARAMSDYSQDALDALEGRFGQGSGRSDMNIQGQNPGNLLFEQVHQRFAGDPERIASTISELFNVRGKVLPATDDSRRLRISLPDGRTIEGEHAAEETDIPSFKGAEIGFIGGEATISPAAEAAIASADMVVLAPGDLYTSVGPNLAVRGMKEALKKATAVVMVTNLMNRNRHTVGYDALDIAEEYERIIGARVIDRVLYNTNEPDQASLLAQSKVGSYPVAADYEALNAAGFRPVGKDLLSHNEVKLDPNDAIAETRSTIRHDPQKVAHALMGIYFGNGFAAKG